LCIPQCVGEDPEREGLLKTPMRAAKVIFNKLAFKVIPTSFIASPESFVQAMAFFTKGYSQTAIGNNPLPLAHTTDIYLHLALEGVREGRQNRAGRRGEWRSVWRGKETI